MDILMQDPLGGAQLYTSMPVSFNYYSDLPFFDDVLPLAPTGFPDTGLTEDAFQNTTEEAKRVIQLPLRGRSRPISPALWERHKPMIEELYIRQGLKLEEVILRMKQDYGFDATDKMYKKRLHDWKMRKYYTQEQKKEAIHILFQEGTIHDHSSLLDSDGRPMHVHRLRRPVQSKGNRIVLLDRRARKSLGRRGLVSLPPATISRLVLQQSAESQNTEGLLRCARVYFWWYSTQDSIEQLYYITPTLSSFDHGLYLAEDCLITNRARAFALLNRCCAKFLDSLKEQSFQLMQILAFHFTTPDSIWNTQQQIRRFVLGLLASSAKEILGDTHPIAQFVSLLQETKPEQNRFLSSGHATLLEDVAETITEPSFSHRVQLGTMDLLKNTGQLEAAWILCRRLRDSVQPVTSSSAPSSEIQHSVLRMTAELSRMREDYDAAEELSMQRISWAIEATGKSNGTYDGVIACWDLALCYEFTGRYLESKKYYRLALAGSLEDTYGYPEDHAFIVEQFEDFVRSHGSADELAQLRDEFGYVWAELDEWTLHPSQLETITDGGY